MKSFEVGQSEEQINQEELQPEEALAHERGVFERFTGKAKEVAGVLLLTSALSTAPGLMPKGYAGERKQPKVQTEQTYRDTKEQNIYVTQVLEAVEEFRQGIAKVKIDEWRDRVCGLQGPDKAQCEDDFKELFAIEGRIKASLREAGKRSQGVKFISH